MEFREHTLDNGLEVVAECNPHARATAIGFFVNAGSRDETDPLHGVSHFLEHMAFKGTPTRTPEDVNRELDEMGSSSNAQTSWESTIYHGTVLPDFQDQMVRLLSDIMRPSLREEDFEAEKQVIIQEILMYEDMPPFNAIEKCMAIFFESHPLARNIIGTVDSVGNMTPAQMRGYFEQRYSPGNIKLVATGDVDFGELIKTADECCGAWESFDVDRDIPRAKPNLGFECVKKETATQQYSIQIADGPATTDPDRYVCRILSTIVGDSSGSRFFWEFIDPGRAEYAEMEATEFQGTGTYMTYLSCRPEDTADNLSRIKRIFADVEQNGVTEEELSRAKNKITAAIVRGSERSSARLIPVGSGWMHRHQYYTISEIIDAYQSVTLDDIAASLEKYPLTKTATFSIGPLDNVAQPD